jgi:hypothetical protein
VAKLGALSLVPSAESAPLRHESWSDPGQFDVWRIGLRRNVLTHVAEFVTNRRATELDEAGVDVAGDILLNFLTGGKCLRSTFMYLGWLSGATDSCCKTMSWTIRRPGGGARRRTFSSASGIESAGYPDRRGASVTQPRSCLVISA